MVGMRFIRIISSFCALLAPVLATHLAFAQPRVTNATIPNSVAAELIAGYQSYINRADNKAVLTGRIHKDCADHLQVKPDDGGINWNRAQKTAEVSFWILDKNGRGLDCLKRHKDACRRTSRDCRSFEDLSRDTSKKVDGNVKRFNPEVPFGQEKPQKVKIMVHSTPYGGGSNVQLEAVAVCQNCNAPIAPGTEAASRTAREGLAVTQAAQQPAARQAAQAPAAATQPRPQDDPNLAPGGAARALDQAPPVGGNDALAGDELGGSERRVPIRQQLAEARAERRAQEEERRASFERRMGMVNGMNVLMAGAPSLASLFIAGRNTGTMSPFGYPMGGPMPYYPTTPQYMYNPFTGSYQLGGFQTSQYPMFTNYNMAPMGSLFAPAPPQSYFGMPPFSTGFAPGPMPGPMMMAPPLFNR